ncbi:MAG: NAD(P)H-binding protein [Henriciella sp.]|nr:NAD(P)H-binding protein [Henriciella sp.]
MSETLLLTGSTGFVGRELLKQLLCDAPHMQVRLLVRNRAKLPPLPDNVTAFEADLLQPDSYRDALHEVDQVIHVAALTGKASAKEHERHNRQATSDLIAACEAASIKHFIFVSSIAAGYANKAFYPYASAKQASEEDLQTSGLRHTIVRPTLVLGPQSAIWDSLNMLASLPITPLPQGESAILVQPVHVKDVCRALMRLVEGYTPSGETLEIGGPDRLTMRELLEQIAVHSGKDSAKILRLPLKLVQWPLALMEPLARPVMPATAGQFSVFGNDSLVQENWLQSEFEPTMVGLAQTIADSDAPADSDPKPPSGPKTDTESAEKESNVMTRHMTGVRADPSITHHYVQALEATGLDREGSRFDQLTLKLLRLGGVFSSLLDVYCGLLRRRGVLRRRQVLLTAILENAAPTHDAFDKPYAKGALGTFAQLAGTGIASGIWFVLSLIALLPIQIALALVAPFIKPNTA